MNALKKELEVSPCVHFPRMLRIRAACQRYSVGSTKMRQIAKAAGAEVRCGGVYWIDPEAVDAYLDGLRKS